jgi:hypothetical protein
VQYTTQKYEDFTYHCWCKAQPEDGERVECLTTSSPREWIIKQVPDSRFYTYVTPARGIDLLVRISPSDNTNLFWGIENGLNGTTVRTSARS